MKETLITKSINMKKVMKAVAAIMLMTVVVCAVGCKKEENVDGDSSINGHTYVDLGLPSGTLWAACNVGATTPEGYGDYFAWGETKPKDTYNWISYKYCNGDYVELTKYCSNSIYGFNDFTDNLTVLEPSDDVANVKWGGGWCMPTRDEWVELSQNTTCTWTTRNGVNGRLFTAGNGNSLFLPAAGERWDDEFAWTGSAGNYWSSSLFTDYPYYVWLLIFDSDYSRVNGYGYDRYYGFSVRPVHSAK